MYLCDLTHQLILSHHEIRRGNVRDQMVQLVQGHEDEEVRSNAQSCSVKEMAVSVTVSSIYDLVVDKY